MRSDEGNKRLLMTKAETNQLNSQKSTGPKDTTSTRYNALKHGLLSEGITELDNVEDFKKLLHDLEEEHRPLGAVETFLVRRLALSTVRLRRIGRLEAEYITEELNPPISKTEGSMIELLAQLDDEKTIVLDEGLPAPLRKEAMEYLSSSFQRYETAIENKLYRSLHELERLQRRRQGEQTPVPAAIDIGIQTNNDQLASFGNLSEESKKT